MTHEQELLMRADAVLSALYHRGGFGIPWDAIGGDGFRTTVYELINQLRAATLLAADVRKLADSE